MLSFLSGAVRIAYIDQPADEGGGKPIVLVHGFASNHAVNWVNTQWVKVLTRAGYRVIALDNVAMAKVKSFTSQRPIMPTRWRQISATF